MKKHTLVLTTILVLTNFLPTFSLVSQAKAEAIYKAKAEEIAKVEVKRSKPLLVSEQKASKNQVKQVEPPKVTPEPPKVQRDNESAKAPKISLPSRGEEIHSITVRASAYDADGSGMEGSGRTATGTHVQEGRTIAVDPRIIPLGSKLILTCDSFPEINGEYIAEDTGGAIKGNKIDVYMRSPSKMKQFGVREVKLTVLGR